MKASLILLYHSILSNYCNASSCFQVFSSRSNSLLSEHGLHLSTSDNAERISAGDLAARCCVIDRLPVVFWLDFGSLHES